MDEQSRESSDITPIEYSRPTTRSHANLEQTKESEKGEFEDSNIVCKNDHSAKKNVLLQGCSYFLVHTPCYSW